MSKRTLEALTAFRQSLQGHSLSPPERRSTEDPCENGVEVALHFYQEVLTPEALKTLRQHPDSERVVQVLLEFCDLAQPRGLREWYALLERELFYAELATRPEEPEPSGTIIHDEGPEPDVEP